MRFYTHILFSILVGLLIIKNNVIVHEQFNEVVFLIMIILAGTLPDLDEPHSKIGKKVPLISWPAKLLLRHRGIIHSLWIPLVSYLIISPFSSIIATGISIGYLSHLVLDALTPAGITPFWPIPWKIRGPIKTGALVEHILALTLLMIDMFLILNSI